MFRDVTFTRGLALIDDATFNDSAHFCNANFTESAHFDDTTFTWVCRLRESDFTPTRSFVRRDLPQRGRLPRGDVSGTAFDPVRRAVSEPGAGSLIEDEVSSTAGHPEVDTFESITLYHSWPGRRERRCEGA